MDSGAIHHSMGWSIFALWLLVSMQLLQSVCIASIGDTPGFEAIFPADYNKFVPPEKINGEPRPVSFYITLLRVQSVDEKNSAITLNLIFRLWWADQRIKTALIPEGQRMFLAKNYYDQMWLPDVYFRHAHYYDSPRLMDDSFSLRAYSNNQFSISKLLTVSLNCPMFFHFYPMDEQTCVVSLGSYMYTTNEVSFTWKGTGVDIDSDARLASGKFEFQLVRGVTRISSSNATSSTYPALDFNVIFRRKLSFYLMQAYVPSSLLVMMSVFSFLVPAKGNVPARMTLCTVSALATSTMFAGIQQQLPEVSYAKAIDVWMLACLVFEAFSFLEFCFVIQYGEYLRRRAAKRAEAAAILTPAPFGDTNSRRIMASSPTATAGNSSKDAMKGLQTDSDKMRRRRGVHSEDPEVISMVPIESTKGFNNKGPGNGIEGKGMVSLAPAGETPTPEDVRNTDRIDKASFVVFAGSFFIFNMVYWSMYLGLFASVHQVTPDGSDSF